MKTCHQLQEKGSEAKSFSEFLLTDVSSSTPPAPLPSPPHPYLLQSMGWIPPKHISQGV